MTRRLHHLSRHHLTCRVACDMYYIEPCKACLAYIRSYPLSVTWLGIYRAVMAWHYDVIMAPAESRPRRSALSDHILSRHLV